MEGTQPNYEERYHLGLLFPLKVCYREMTIPV